MVVRLADFLDRELSEQAVDTIVQHCTFDSMKSNKMVNREKLPISDIFDMSKSKFMRKGMFTFSYFISTTFTNHFSCSIVSPPFGRFTPKLNQQQLLSTSNRM